MAGRGEPPEGGPSPGGGEDDYGSVVFDETFVKAAPLQELSARERLGPEHRPAVRRRRPDRLPLTKGVRRLSALLVVLLMAFGTAIYLGLQRPSSPPAVYPPPRLNTLLIPLVGSTESPAAELVPGALAAVPTRVDPFAGTPAEHYRVGADGMPLPKPRGTDHFTPDEVLSALRLAREYLVAANVDAAALLGGGTAKVRSLIDQRQYKQFDTSMDHPLNNGQNTATGWLTRFDPNKVALATADVRVRGTISYRELNQDYLEITTDHTFVYGLMAGSSKKDDDDGEPAVLPFTIRRELSIQFDHTDVRDNTLRVVQSIAQAGPQSCATDASAFFRPVFPKASPAAEAATPGGVEPGGAVATPGGSSSASPQSSVSATGSPSPSASASPRVPAVDPYDHGTSAADTICGVLK